MADQVNLSPPFGDDLIHANDTTAELRNLIFAGGGDDTVLAAAALS